MTTTVPGSSLKARPGRGGSMAACLALAGAIFAAGLQPSAAQSVDDQLQRLQRELSDLQRQVYGGEAPAAGAATSGGAPTQAARFQVRLDDFEVQLRQLTGRVEDMSFQLQSVTDRLDKLVADVDLRLRNLEQGGQPPLAGADTQDGQMAAPPDSQAPDEPTSQTSPGTLGTLSESDLNAFQGDQEGAATAQGAQDAPASQPAAPQTAAAPSGTAALPDGPPEAQYDYAFGLLRQANYAGAEQAFSAFLAQHPDHGLSGNAKYWLGETYYVRGDYQQAAVTFAEGFESYPDNSKAPDNLLKLGMSLASLGSTQDACGTFDVLLERYADAPATILSRAQRESQRLKCP